MTRRPALLAVPLLVLAAACAPQDEGTSAGGSSSPSGESCATSQLALKKPGTLTIGTDSPAFPPWFVANDPTNGKGFESAVAYAVADQL